MKKVLCLGIALIFYYYISAQKSMVEYKFISTHQIDKTADGSFVKSNHKATIQFRDPKPVTNNNSKVEDKPKGKLTIMYSELRDPITNDIIFFGNDYEFGSAKNQAFYGISKSDADFNTFIFINKPMAVEGISYKYLLLVGNMDQTSGKFKTQTIYCCN